jgi:transcriptional regulator with XRE-family HTH domain
VSPQRADYADRIGKQIFKRRTALRVSQTRLAKESGIHRNSICRWENGQGLPCTFNHHLVLAALKRLEQEQVQP